MDRTSSATSSRPGGPGSSRRPRFPGGAIDDDDDDLLGSYSGTSGTPPAALAGAVGTASSSAPAALPARRRRPAVAGVGLVIALGIVAVLAYRLGSHSTSTSSAPPTRAPSTTTTATTLPATGIFQLVAPSVVLITTAKGSLGTGVIVNATGTILTANHVISDGSSVTLTFSDSTRSTGTVTSTDPATDVATLTPATLPEVVVPATLGGGVQVGADVVAIGNPLGFTDSTSSGIVSGLDRTADTKAGKFSGLIQFDAAVNPGSSGGPLLNNQGLVVGIVVSLANAAQDDSFAGIGFAVPIGTALGGGGEGPGGGPQK